MIDPVSALQVFVVERQGYAQVQFPRVFENVVASRSVVNKEARSAKRPQNFPRFYGGQAPTHAGIATLIFSLTGSNASLGSLGIASPSFLKLSR